MPSTSVARSDSTISVRVFKSPNWDPSIYAESMTLCQIFAASNFGSMKILSAEYEESKNRALEDETMSSSSTSSSSTSPSSTPSSSCSTTPSTSSASSSIIPSTSPALGDALLPHHGANFEKEWKKLQRDIKKMMLFMSLSMLNLQIDRLHLSCFSTIYCVYAENDSGFFGYHITDREVPENPVYKYHLLVYQNASTQLLAELTRMSILKDDLIFLDDIHSAYLRQCLLQMKRSQIS